MSFKPFVVPPAENGRPALWFAFREDRLLLEADGDALRLPLRADLSGLGLQPLRRQFLGTLGGCPAWSAELPADAPAPPGGGLAGPARGVRPGARRSSSGSPAGRRRSRTGTATTSSAAAAAPPWSPRPEERVKACPRCGLLNYPRISPAVIVAVTRGDRILLARARRFTARLYSVIAGFVEAGETLEECMHREVEEETGILVRDLRYFGSQPWPFPDSLMIAFTAEHAAGEIRIDETEIVEAGWFRAGELPEIPGPDQHRPPADRPLPRQPGRKPGLNAGAEPRPPEPGRPPGRLGGSGRPGPPGLYSMA